MTDLARLDAVAQADLVRRGELTPLEIVEAAIERIESVDPWLNAVVWRLFDRARREAAGPLPDGPLRGVPLLLKDLGTTLHGAPQTDGSVALRDRVAAEDSELTRRYRGLGLVVLGKTATPEFGNHSTAEAVLWGPTRNPWDPGRTTGGSSGGSGAAVASGMVPAAHGTDGAGSIRIPASCCGVVGLKPSRGRTPSVFPGIAMNGLDSEHVLTRSVRDSEAFLAGTMDPIPADDALAARRATRLTGTRGALRIAWTAKPPFAGVAVDPACVAAAADAASLLRSLGHDVDEGAPAFDGEVLIEPFARVWAIANLEAHDDVAAFLRRRPRPDELEETTWELVEFARTLGSGALREARGRLDAAARDVAPFFERFDAWLTPTLARPPERLGVLNRSQGGAVEWWRFDCSFNPWNPMANMTGQPAISVPFSESADGLPIGVLLTAAVGDEPTLFRLAGQMEEARPWADRRPGIHAGGTPTGSGVTRG